MPGFFRFLFNHFCSPIIFVCPLLLIGSCSEKNPINIENQSLDRYMEIINLAKVQVQKTRELEFIRPVSIGLLTRKQYSNYNEQWSSDNSALIMREFKQIGFIPDTFSNTNFIATNDDNFAAAFYKPGSDSLYVIDAELYDRGALFGIVAHEFTHALQEQHFNPFTNQTFSASNQSALNSDFYLSQRCVIEGDATLSQVHALYSIIDSSTTDSINVIDSITAFTNNYRENYYLDLADYEFPRYLEIQGYAPYQLGASFIFDIYKRGGWEKVNALFHSNRVNSTADIINLTNTTPFTFDFSKIMPLLLKNTTRLVFADDDTYGPVMLMALLNEQVDTAHCKKAFGWQGDRLTYTLSDNQAFGSFVWAMKFTTADDARYIMNKIDEFLSTRKIGGSTAIRLADTKGITFTRTTTSTLLKQSSNLLLWIENVQQQDSVVTLLTTPSLARRTVSEKNYSTISADDKCKFIDKYLGVNR